MFAIDHTMNVGPKVDHIGDDMADAIENDTWLYESAEGPTP